MVEIESKFKVEDVSEILKVLDEKGFTSDGGFFEKTVMYDNKEELMKRSNGRARLKVSGDNVF